MCTTKDVTQNCLEESVKITNAVYQEPVNSSYWMTQKRMPSFLKNSSNTFFRETILPSSTQSYRSVASFLNPKGVP